MIDIFNEDLILIRDVPRHVPPKARGRRVHISAVYRWIKYGVHGGVRLEVVKIGGATYTSKEALQEFTNRSSAAARGSPTTTASVTARRKKQIDEAARQVDAILEDTHSRKPQD